MPKKILLVEDDDLLIRMYKRMLVFRGYSVETAQSGHECLQKAKKYKPDVIILDIMLPKLHGLNVLTVLKKHTTTKHIPVMMLTNVDGQDDIAYATSQGAVAYLIKSNHDADEVIDVMQQILAQHSPQSHLS